MVQPPRARHRGALRDVHVERAGPLEGQERRRQVPGPSQTLRRADRLGFAQILGVDQFHPAAGIQNRRFDRLYAGLADAVAQVDALTRDDPSPPPM